MQTILAHSGFQGDGIECNLVLGPKARPITALGNAQSTRKPIRIKQLPSPHRSAPGPKGPGAERWDESGRASLFIHKTKAAGLGWYGPHRWCLKPIHNQFKDHPKSGMSLDVSSRKRVGFTPHYFASLGRLASIKFSCQASNQKSLTEAYRSSGSPIRPSTCPSPPESSSGQESQMSPWQPRRSHGIQMANIDQYRPTRKDLE